MAATFWSLFWNRHPVALYSDHTRKLFLYFFYYFLLFYFYFFLPPNTIIFLLNNKSPTHLMPVIALLPPAITLYIAVKAVWTSQKKPEQQLHSGPSGQFASKQWQHPSCQQLCLLLDTSVNSHLWFLIISTFMARLLCCDSPKNWPGIKKNS